MSHVKSVQAMSWTKRSATATFQRMVQERHRQIGENIVRIREARGWSQERLAHEAKVSSKTVSRLENGGSEGRGGTMRQIAGALGVTIGEILTTTQDAVPDDVEASTQLDRMEALLIELLERVENLEDAMPSGADGLEAELEDGGRPPSVRDDDSESDEPEDQAEGQ